MTNPPTSYTTPRDTTGIVPRHIEGQGLDGLCIAQIVQLLQKQDPDDNV